MHFLMESLVNTISNRIHVRKSTEVIAKTSYVHLKLKRSYFTYSAVSFFLEIFKIGTYKFKEMRIEKISFYRKFLSDHLTL